MAGVSRIVAARQLALAAATSEVLDAMAQAGVRAIMLKGAAIGARLYEDPSVRLAGDLDLLVEPRQAWAATQVLARLGFRDPLARARIQERARHAATFRREGARPATIDLHTTFAWCTSPPERVWDEFSRHTTIIDIDGRPVEVLADPAQALVIAAHTIHHVGVAKLDEDLRRAVARYDRATWEQAAAIARRLDAHTVLAAGLTRVHGGARLAGELGLTHDGSSVEVRLLRAGEPPVALGLVRMSETRSARRRLVFVLSEVLPSRAWMRDAYPFAARSPAALMLAYLYRPLWLAARLPRALVAWRRASTSP